MNIDILNEAIGRIDASIVEEALSDEGGKSAKAVPFARRPWLKWVVAAILIVVIGVGTPVALNMMGAFRGESPVASNGSDPLTPMVDAGLYINGDTSVRYHLMNGGDVHRFDPLMSGKMPEGYSSLLHYHIMEKDLGKKTGEVSDDRNGELTGADVYSYSLLPDIRALRIIRYDGKYRFFVGDYTSANGVDGENIRRSVLSDCSKIDVYRGEIVAFYEQFEKYLSTSDGDIIKNVCAAVLDSELFVPSDDRIKKEFQNDNAEVYTICFYTPDGFWTALRYYPNIETMVSESFHRVPLERCEFLNDWLDVRK